MTITVSPHHHTTDRPRGALPLRTAPEGNETVGIIKA
jgi:hypothetical protein